MVTLPTPSMADALFLNGKKGLIIGIANEHSIAYGCAKAFRQHGASLAITYVNEKCKGYVEPLLPSIEPELFMPLDVTHAGQLDAVFEAIEKHWGKLDFVIHSIAFAPKAALQGRVVDVTAADFDVAMNISCHSFIEIARRAEPLMKDGGTLFAMSYHGAQKIVSNYNIMGPIKATLEAICRYVAAELGAKGIRVHAISPGPLRTRAASGIAEFDELLDRATAQSPMHTLVTIDDVGTACAALASDGARLITGGTIYIDGGFNIMA